MSMPASPRPWKLAGNTIWDADGGVVVSALSPCDRATRRLIVDAVNDRDHLRDLVRRFCDLFTPGTIHPDGTIERLLRAARRARRLGRGLSPTRRGTSRIWPSAPHTAARSRRTSATTGTSPRGCTTNGNGSARRSRPARRDKAGRRSPANWQSSARTKYTKETGNDPPLRQPLLRHRVDRSTAIPAVLHALLQLLALRVPLRPPVQRQRGNARFCSLQSGIRHRGVESRGT